MPRPSGDKMAIPATLLDTLRAEAIDTGKPLHPDAFLYEQPDGSIWLDKGYIGTEPKKVQDAPPPSPPPPPP